MTTMTVMPPHLAISLQDAYPCLILHPVISLETRIQIQSQRNAWFAAEHDNIVVPPSRCVSVHAYLLVLLLLFFLSASLTGGVRPAPIRFVLVPAAALVDTIHGLFPFLFLLLRKESDPLTFPFHFHPRKSVSLPSLFIFPLI